MILGRASIVCWLGWLTACTPPTGAAESHARSDAETNVTLSLPTADEDRFGQLMRELETTRGVTADELRARREPAHAPTLAYDPQSAAGLERIQGSTLALGEEERKRLSELGFMVSADKSFPTMLYAYASLYVEDLPLYVSADSILDAVYRSYEAILVDIEESVLVPDLAALVSGMRSALAEIDAEHRVRADVDFYLAVTQSLLDGSVARPVAGANEDEIASFVTRIRKAEGHDARPVFGVERDIDFSQFKPRGHYTATRELERYFQALTWLGRVDLRLIETLPTGEQVFHRRQLEAAILMRRLLDAEGMARYRRIDATLVAFAGPSDAMRLPEIDALLFDLEVESLDALELLGEQKIAQTIVDRGYGTQQIASRLLRNATAAGRKLPLDRSFAVLGQRYTVDSHVLSNVVHDVVPNRLMPDPLDAAYAVFGNDAAAGLLGSELDQYAPALESARRLVDAHEPKYWTGSLYTSWLGSLRSLSARDRDLRVPAGAAWDARVLNTQLASWAQLRHATALYAKQSYTSAVLCEYPDAYVEPYPEFFVALTDFATRGDALAEALRPRHEPLADKLHAYFDNLATAMTTLGAMAELERAGKPFTASHLAFINQAVHHYPGCPGPETFDGWYAKLDYEIMPNGRVMGEANPIISDIHTQPTDERGRDAGRILHIGTGLPRLMVVTVDSCQGPRAYAGPVFSYHQLITEDWLRLNDAEWSERVFRAEGEAPSEAPWVSSFVVRAP